MTVTISRNGDIVLQGIASEKLSLKSGNRLVVRKSRGHVILRPASSKPRQRKAYLNSRPLSRSTLTRLYSNRERAWDKVEAAAVSQSRELLAR